MSSLNPLNPATGDVPIPEDQREVKAALAAGKLSLRIFPYLVWRYGERGKRFTHSDSAWLVWLTRHNQERVYEQIMWLRGVLASRGMPSWILDTHLTVLHRELVRRIPENEQKYLVLSACATRLREAREAQISAERLQSSVAEFLSELRRGPSFLLTGAALLLLAAVADEKLGVKNAVSSLETWLLDVSGLRRVTCLREVLSDSERRWLDSEQFQRFWKNTVAATIANARRE